MLSERAESALRDILRNIELVRDFTRDLTFPQFKADTLTLYATTRALEIISEASRRLPDELKERHPDLPWKQIATAGNVYRHGYDIVVADIIWQTVETGLDALAEAALSEVEKSNAR